MYYAATTQNTKNKQKILTPFREIAIRLKLILQQQQSNQKRNKAIYQ